MFFFLSPDEDEDYFKFQEQLQVNPWANARMVNQLPYKELGPTDKPDWIQFSPTPFEMPVNRLPRKYAVSFDPSSGRLHMKICNIDINVSVIL